MLNTRYTVWATNADLEEVQNFYIGDSCDIAETLACRLFVKSGMQKDFMVTARNGYETEIHASVFSDRTKRLRGECQG
jgi:hypothetical protein